MRTILTLFLLSFSTFLFSQNEKKALSNKDFDSWNVLRNSQISHDGNLISFEVNQQLGDGVLHIQGLASGAENLIPRGKDLKFHPQNQFAAFMIKAPYDSTRKAKLKKTKKDKMPKDTLGIWVPGKEMMKVGQVKSFQMAQSREGTSSVWIAYQLEKNVKFPKDSTEKKEEKEEPKKNTAKKKKKGGDKKASTLVLFNPISGDSIHVPKVSSYKMSADGSLTAMTRVFGDSIDSVRIYLFKASDKSLEQIYQDQGKAMAPVFSKDSKQMAFLASTDTAKQKVYQVFHRMEGRAINVAIVNQYTPGMPDNWAPSEHARLRFSEKGSRLFVGSAAIPEPEVKDTLTADEKYQVDVWNWKDKRLQPMQKLNLDRDKKRNYTGVYDFTNSTFVQLGSKDMQRLRFTSKDEGEWALGYDGLPYQRESSWSYPRKQDIYLLNVKTGTKELVRKGSTYNFSISPMGRYLVWYNTEDKNWYGMSVAERKIRNLTEGLEVNFYNEDFDIPSEPSPYGIAGWSEGDEFVYIRDRYDWWKIDVSGQKKAENFMKGFGRENKIRFTPLSLDREQLHLDDFPMMKGFDEKTKEDGFYLARKKGEPEQLLASAHRYGRPQKAVNAEKLIWTRQSFTEFPDLWTSDMSLKATQKLSTANPQQKDFLWGSVELMSWEAYDGKKLEGMLYKPENFDPNKQYPMLVYFYERSSDGLHRYWMPMPSRSIIYPSYYASNDYLVFIPDITYETGQPGPDAYNAVVSGTEHLVKTHSFIDKDRLGIQGQSWGGYQTAYIITKTDMYAAAMAGAPVSNMTSAYGGIRWGSGMSRMFQYERTQSRLGVTLWEDKERYLKNSPLFFAPDVKTPLLMMHNDTDGAVPWYQGIEFFVALRRLNKPVWLLVYNKEAHNLRRWANRKDLDIRMKQFFDHYLQGAAVPVWMEEGVPALEKGQKTGYELIEMSKDK
ncbi:MAG: prolyl oligopeptidase family serine peptidase [Bacteroidota bacterium]